MVLDAVYFESLVSLCKEVQDPLYWCIPVFDFLIFVLTRPFIVKFNRDILATPAKKLFFEGGCLTAADWP